MTQDYLNQLFANYPQGDVPQIYWTADGNAFIDANSANDYAKRLTNQSIKTVAHGGNVEDAIVLEEPFKQDTTNEVPVSNSEAQQTNSEEQVDNTDYEAMKVVDLIAMCKERNIEIKSTKKAELIILLLQDDLKNEEATIDYSAMDLAQLQNLCKEREIDVAGVEGDAEKLTSLLQEWDVKNATEVTE